MLSVAAPAGADPAAQDAWWNPAGAYPGSTPLPAPPVAVRRLPVTRVQPGLPLDPWYRPPVAVAPARTVPVWPNVAAQAPSPAQDIPVPYGGSMPSLPFYSERDPAVQYQFPEAPAPDGLLDEGELYWGPGTAGDERAGPFDRLLSDEESREITPERPAGSVADMPGFLDPWQLMPDWRDANGTEAGAAAVPEPASVTTERAPPATERFRLPATGPASGLLPMLSGDRVPDYLQQAGTWREPGAGIHNVFVAPVVDDDLLDVPPTHR